MKQKFFLPLALAMLLPTAAAWAHKIPIDRSEKIAGRQIQSLIQQFTNERGLLLEPTPLRTSDIFPSPSSLNLHWDGSHHR